MPNVGVWRCGMVAVILNALNKRLELIELSETLTVEKKESQK
jgi:hypothetical protein